MLKILTFISLTIVFCKLYLSSLFKNEFLRQNLFFEKNQINVFVVIDKFSDKKLVNIKNYVGNKHIKNIDFIIYFLDKINKCLFFFQKNKIFILNYLHQENFIINFYNKILFISNKEIIFLSENYKKYKTGTTTISSVLKYINVINYNIINIIVSEYKLDVYKIPKYRLTNNKGIKKENFLILSGKTLSYFDVKDHVFFKIKNEKIINRNKLTCNFICSPISKRFRVSSKFNLRRINPVTGRISPHLGVDFAVPIGTPVLATCDGKVIVSKRDNIAGNYVAINHGNKRITRYMHLNKLFVKSGQKVKCGEKIALSGNTGRSTGPHLHYEVWINHHPINPLNIKLFLINTSF